MDTNKISFIYFDVGGVLIKDYSKSNKWEETKQDLGVNRNTDAGFEAIWERYADRYCTDYDVDELMPLFISELGLSLKPGYSFMQDFVDRFEINPDIWPLVNRLSNRYQLGLLTNMYPRMLPAIYKKGLLKRDDWAVTVDSSDVKMQKPNRDIYEYATKLAGVESQEILFIDNTLGHLEVPKQIGWQTFHFDSSDYAKSTQSLANFFDV